MATAPCGVWKITDIPQASVGMVMRQFRDAGAKTVTKEQQPDGNWTVTATYDPCPDGEPQETTSSHSG